MSGENAEWGENTVWGEIAERGGEGGGRERAT